MQLFGRRVEDNTVRSAVTIFMMYLTLPVLGAVVISMADRLPVEVCLFEAVSAIGTVGLSLGITPSLGAFSHFILILLMFFGRVDLRTFFWTLACPIWMALR